MTDIAKLADLIAPRLSQVLMEAQGVYDVAAEGAIPDNSTACLAAFQATAAKVTARSASILVSQPASVATATPLYRLANGRWIEDNIGTGADEVPGGTTDLRYRIGLESGPLLVPHGHRILGQGGYPRNVQTPVGSEIWALAGMTRRLEVTALSSSGTTVTCDANNHGLTTGNSVTVTGASPASFNGTYTVTVVDWNTFTYSASSFTGSATGSFVITTAVAPRVVQLGPSNNTAGLDFSRAERLTINGRDVSGAIGVWTDCAQENSGVYDAAIIGCHTGIVAAASGGIVPANFYIERTNVVLSSVAGNQGNGVQIMGGKLTLNKISAVTRGVPHVAGSGYVLRGSDHIGNNLHFEGFDYGLTIGGPATGTPNDTGVWDYNITVDNLHGFNLPTQRGLISAVRIRNNSTSVFGVRVTDITINTHNTGVAWAPATAYSAGARVSIPSSSAVQLEFVSSTGTGLSGGSAPAAGVVGATVVDNEVTWRYVHLCALVIDEVNGINIPSNSSANHRQLAFYRFGGTMGDDAGSAVKRPVFTSYYDGLCPDGAVKALASANSLDRTFVGGALADILQLNGATEIRMVTNPYPGAVVYLDIQSGAPTIKHLTGATATQQIHTSTGADITTAAGFYRLTYGDARGAADKWYCEAA